MYNSAYGLSAGGANAAAYFGPVCKTVRTPDNPPLICGLEIFCHMIIIILNFLMFLNLLCSCGLDGLWSGATSIFDDIFSFQYKALTSSPQSKIPFLKALDRSNGVSSQF